jgi:putative PIN family toxin of toxin-antitoxin system
VPTHQIVIDTNVFVSALRSRRGASFKLLSLIDSGKFQVNVSVPLILEYEEKGKQLVGGVALTAKDIDDILNYICKIAHRRQVFYLWRPFLKDPKDDLVLELAVSADCAFIITYNQRDFQGVEQFGIQAITPKEFLGKRGAVR